MLSSLLSETAPAGMVREESVSVYLEATSTIIKIYPNLLLETSAKKGPMRPMINIKSSCPTIARA